MLQYSKIINTLIFSSLVFFTACSEEEIIQKTREAPPLPVNTITVKKEPVAIWKQYTGQTKASSEQEIRARVSGILEEVYFQDGANVKQGEKLFKIEQERYIAALHAAKAKKAQDEASLRLAKADVARYEPLVKEGLAPRATLEQFQAQVAGLEAMISGDIAQIKQRELELSYTIIHSPISGIVSARRVDVGNLVGQGESTLLTTIMQIDPLYTYFSPSQDDARLFQKYRDKEKPFVFIKLKGSRDDVRLDGFVDFQNNTVDPHTATITMRATIENKQNKILPGTFVYVNLFINDKYEFRMIPPQIISSDQLGDFIYVVDADSNAKRVNIKTDYSAKHYVSVSEGLEDGDRVIVSALVKLSPGRKVIPSDVTSTQGIQAILKKHKLIPQKY